jgi:thiosulfate reductase cytochrome b subunit
VKPRRPQPIPIRITHWINVVVITVMAMSGLQILRAYPRFGPRGATYDWVPLQDWDTPDWSRAGRWLAGARHLHFALMWLFVGNALVYVVYVLGWREYRRRWIRPLRDLGPAVRQQLYYLDGARYQLARVVARIARKPHWARRWIEEPPAGLYNALQRAAYTAAIVLGLLEVLSGLAIWKPVQLHWLAWLFGGYDGARVVHFLGLLALAGFVIAHVVMVLLHWRRFPEMITGGHADADATAMPPPTRPLAREQEDAHA